MRFNAQPAVVSDAPVSSGAPDPLHPVSKAAALVLVKFIKSDVLMTDGRSAEIMGGL